VDYDRHLAARVRARLNVIDAVVESLAFGGWMVSVGGELAVGVIEHSLVVRVGREHIDATMGRPGVRPMSLPALTTEWVYIVPAGISDGRALDGWIARGVACAERARSS
jgi:hypothetical protein